MHLTGLHSQSHPAFHGHQLSLGQDVNHWELARVYACVCVRERESARDLLIPSIYITKDNHKAMSDLE